MSTVTAAAPTASRRMVVKERGEGIAAEKTLNWRVGEGETVSKGLRTTLQTASAYLCICAASGKKHPAIQHVLLLAAKRTGSQGA